jgi:hypothetical protein
MALARPRVRHDGARRKELRGFSRGRSFFGESVLHLLWDVGPLRYRAGIGGVFREKGMATLDEIGQQRQKLAEQLAKLDAQREKLAEEVKELEAAERVLARFAKPAGGGRRRRARAAAPAAARPRRARAAAAPAATISLSEAALRAVRAHTGGISASAVLAYLQREFGLSVRPNHLGIALQRHRRAGRLEQHDTLWYAPSGQESGAAA